MTYKQFVAMKAFILFEDKVLLIKESSKYEEGTNKGKFDLVGGRIKPGEKFDLALIREAKEETNLDIQIKRPLMVSEWRPVVKGEPWQVIGTYFICSTKNKEVILSKDHSEYLWIDPKSYKSYDLIDGLEEVFEEFLKIHEL